MSSVNDTLLYMVVKAGNTPCRSHPFQCANLSKSVRICLYLSIVCRQCSREAAFSFGADRVHTTAESQLLKPADRARLGGAAQPGRPAPQVKNTSAGQAAWEM